MGFSTSVLSVLALLLLSAPSVADARALAQSVGHCNASSRCAEFCQGYGLRYDGFLAAAHCVQTNSGREQPCVNGVNQCVESTSDTYYAASGCFCCCVETTGAPSDAREMGPPATGTSDCETFCSGFSAGFVANLCSANINHSEGGKRYCAVNYLGTPIGCAHTSTSRSGDPNKNCCCNSPFV